MTRVYRLVAWFIAGLVVAVAAVSLAVAPTAAPAGAAPLLTATPLPPPDFDATLTLTPSRTTVAVGQTVRLTADLTVTGCNYPIMELRVEEDNDAEPVFAHVEPPDDIISPPVSFPSPWTFRAERPGTAIFAAQTFGETDCNGWQWHYENAWSVQVDALEMPYSVWLVTVASL